LSGELRDDLYRGLIAAGSRRGLTALLVVRDRAGLRPAGRELLSALRPALIAETVSSEWPGTRLLSGTATLRRFQLNTASAALLTGAAESLYDWVQPALPEDLCLLRPDGTPWIVTIAPERDAYFELSLAEQQELLTELPQLAARISSVVGSAKFDHDVGPVWLQVSTVPGAVRLVISLLRSWDVDLLLDAEAAHTLSKAIRHPGQASIRARTVEGVETTVGVDDGRLSLTVAADQLDPVVPLGARRSSVAAWLQSAATAAAD
jgi:hypothetical protein